MDFYKKNFKYKNSSQIFLVNKFSLHLISKLIIPIFNCKIIEIGSGSGNLTNNLLYYKYLYDISIITIEIDRKFCYELKKNNNTITIFNINILNFNIYNAIKIFKRFFCKFYLIGNLPYNISMLILFHLINFINIIYNQFFMLQKELVQKILLKNNIKKLSNITIIIQSLYKIVKLINVKRIFFTPSPNVDSIFIGMEPLYLFLIKLSDLSEFRVFLNLINKKHIKSFKEFYKKYNKITNLSDLSIDLNFKFKNLSIDLYIKIFYKLKRKKIIIL